MLKNRKVKFLLLFSDHELPFTKLITRDNYIINYFLKYISSLRNTSVEEVANDLNILKKNKETVTNNIKETSSVEEFDPLNMDFFPSKLNSDGRLLRPPK